MIKISMYIYIKMMQVDIHDTLELRGLPKNHTTV